MTENPDISRPRENGSSEPWRVGHDGAMQDELEVLRRQIDAAQSAGAGFVYSGGLYVDALGRVLHLVTAPPAGHDHCAATDSATDSDVPIRCKQATTRSGVGAGNLSAEAKRSFRATSSSSMKDATSSRSISGGISWFTIKRMA